MRPSDAKAKKKRAHLLISGGVQGVWYRSSTKQQADDLGLTGWVRNCQSGQVEVIVEGADAAINELISWCRTGSSMARVTDVRIDFDDYRGEFVGFRVKG
jgi:acylphosphatase